MSRTVSRICNVAIWNGPVLEGLNGRRIDAVLLQSAFSKTSFRGVSFAPGFVPANVSATN
jgi:hypothetical protein